MKWRRFLNRTTGVSLLLMIVVAGMLGSSYFINRQAQENLRFANAANRDVTRTVRNMNRTATVQAIRQTQSVYNTHLIAQSTAYCITYFAQETAIAVLGTAGLATPTRFATPFSALTVPVGMPTVGPPQMTASAIIGAPTATQCAMEAEGSTHPVTCAIVYEPAFREPCLLNLSSPASTAKPE